MNKYALEERASCVSRVRKMFEDVPIKNVLDRRRRDYVCTRCCDYLALANVRNNRQRWQCKGDCVKEIIGIMEWISTNKAGRTSIEMAVQMLREHWG